MWGQSPRCWLPVAREREKERERGGERGRERETNERMNHNRYSDECHLELEDMIDTLVLGLPMPCLHPEREGTPLYIQEDTHIGDRMWAHIDVAVGRQDSFNVFGSVGAHETRVVTASTSNSIVARAPGSARARASCGIGHRVVADFRQGSALVWKILRAAGTGSRNVDHA